MGGSHGIRMRCDQGCWFVLRKASPSRFSDSSLSMGDCDVALLGIAVDATAVRLTNVAERRALFTNAVAQGAGFNVDTLLVHSGLTPFSGGVETC